MNIVRDWYTTESTLFLTEVQAGDFGAYKCVSTWSDGSTTTVTDDQRTLIISKSEYLQSTFYMYDYM